MLEQLFTYKIGHEPVFMLIFGFMTIAILLFIANKRGAFEPTITQYWLQPVNYNVNYPRNKNPHIYLDGKKKVRLPVIQSKQQNPITSGETVYDE